MRTKSLIVGAALLAAGVATSMAQSNVYSLNVVGYINLTISNQLTLVANQLDADGTGTNNLLTNVLNGIPNGTTVYVWSQSAPGGPGFGLYVYAHNSWSTPPGFPSTATATLNPGDACFISPSATYLATNPAGFTITTVGQVLQGTWTNQYISTGLSVLSSVAPLSGAIDSTGNGGLGYVPTKGDAVYIWDNTLTPPTYDIYTFAHNTWSPSDPILNPGQGFFLSTTNVAPVWTNTFTVQ